jgi:hypothetical protein
MSQAVVVAQAVVVQAVKKIKIKLKPHQLALVKQVSAVVVPAIVAVPAVVVPAIVAVPAVVAPAVVAVPAIVAVPAVVKKIKVKLQKLVQVNPPAVVKPIQKSVWLSYARPPKEKPLALVWESVEDISDDEDDTPQAAGKRLSTLKATRDQIQHRAYKAKVAQMQNAGLFLGWEKKVQKTHSNYSYDVQSTYAYPINKY